MNRALIITLDTYSWPNFSASIMKSQLARDNLGLIICSDLSTMHPKAVCADRNWTPAW